MQLHRALLLRAVALTYAKTVGAIPNYLPTEYTLLGIRVPDIKQRTSMQLRRALLLRAKVNTD